MAYYTIRIFSEALRRNTTFQMLLPNDRAPRPPYGERKTRLLFLLHGYTAGDLGNCIPEELCEKYNFAVVIPNGENGFWLDGLSTGHRYCAFLGEELIGYLRKTFGLGEKREDTCLIGMSMGGFGALHTALAYPKVFGKAAALSSALIVHDIAHMKEGGETPLANYAYYRECFGDLERVEESGANPETLAKRLKESGEELPEIFMCCGTEDFLLENNRVFHRFLDKIGVAHTYLESAGGHDMTFWNDYLTRFTEEMFR